MSATAIARRAATALWPGLRRILIRLGRWVMRELAYEGAKALAAYMRSRVRVFEHRLQRIQRRKRHSKLRVEFLKGRIRRWKAASRWFDKNAAHLKGRVIKAFDKMLNDAVPENAPHESFARWKRKKAA